MHQKLSRCINAHHTVNQFGYRNIIITSNCFCLLLLYKVCLYRKVTYILCNTFHGTYFISNLLVIFLVYNQFLVILVRFIYYFSIFVEMYLIEFVLIGIHTFLTHYFFDKTKYLKKSNMTIYSIV